MAVEERNGGVYYQYSFIIAEYDIRSAAIRSLEWFAAERNRLLDSDRYSYRLTHRKCILTVKISQGEYVSEKKRAEILNRAQYEISQTRDTIISLMNGTVPEDIQHMIREKFGIITNEW